MDAAACIGCGACVAACPNGSASLFTAAKISHLGLLPQGQPERYRRALRMVAQMDAEGFGHCTLYGECQEACPKEISIDTIARMNRDYLRRRHAREEKRSADGLSWHVVRACTDRTKRSVRVQTRQMPFRGSYATRGQLGGADVEKTTYVIGNGTETR